MSISSNSRITLIVAILALVLLAALYFFRSPASPGPLNDPDADRRAVLVAPAPQRAEEYEKIVARLAESSAMLVIDAGCVVSPLVLRIPEGAPIAVQNNDSVPHAIAFEGDADAKFLFGVPAGLSLDFNPSAFGKRAGIYRYRCAAGAEEKNAGVLYITE